jgi:hypothetical protein
MVIYRIPLVFELNPAQQKLKKRKKRGKGQKQMHFKLFSTTKQRFIIK